jgi:nucleoside-diphosphate-sugar epimerase
MGGFHGRDLVEGLHQVVAFTRRPDALSDPHALEAVIKGDGRDRDKMRAAVAGSDAVISIINGGGSDDPHRAAQATDTIIAAMTESGVQRLVVTSPYPLVARKPRIPLAVLRRVLATPYADVREMDMTLARAAVNVCGG